jgi:hypothetical protein
MSDELTNAIRKLKPNAEFSFTDNDYSTIQWNNLDGEAPTKMEIDAAIKEIKSEKAAAKAKAAIDKTALLAKLGITDDEAKLLLS